eukprot:Skav208760  [mRNA]  locus=scaffold1871:328210:331472:- [translate_table: standard]
MQFFFLVFLSFWTVRAYPKLKQPQKQFHAPVPTSAFIFGFGCEEFHRMGRDRGRDRGRGYSQAELLRARGDVRTTTLSFEVRLSAPGARARPKADDPMSRLGLHLRRTQERTSSSLSESCGNVPLEVAEVDQRVGQFTPVAQWNFREVQRAYRGGNERRASRDIKPGDKILAVNGAEVDGAMLSELQSAASMSSPKNLDLRLQREMLDVFGPQPDPMDERRDSVGCLGERTWKPKAPEPEGLAPSSRRSTRSERRSESARLGGLAALALAPQNEERRATSAEPYTSPKRNSRSREAVGMSSLNQAARSMLHC